MVKTNIAVVLDGEPYCCFCFDSYVAGQRTRPKPVPGILKTTQQMMQHLATSRCAFSFPPNWPDYRKVKVADDDLHSQLAEKVDQARTRVSNYLARRAQAAAAPALQGAAPRTGAVPRAPPSAPSLAQSLGAVVELRADGGSTSIFETGKYGSTDIRFSTQGVLMSPEGQQRFYRSWVLGAHDGPVEPLASPR